jgi:hypothetical protein
MLRVIRGLISILAAATSIGCDESFTPIAPTELQFSVFGYLDASADTQWVRVMPIRSLLPTSPAPLGATVTLEHLGTGRVVELRDSVFRFAPSAEVGSDGTYLNNFWTTEPVEPGAAYRFSARLPGGQPSEAVVAVPPGYQVEVWIRQPRTPGYDLVRLSGLEHVAFVILLRHYVNACGPQLDRYVYRTSSSDGDAIVIPLTSPPLLPIACGGPEIQKRELLIVGSGAPWPSGMEYRSSTMGNLPSNISNSIGFLGGVLTRVVLYETCVFENEPSATDHCRLRYEGDSGMVSGIVTCGGEPVPRATVRLREGEADAAGRRKIRTALATRAGEYQIAAVEPGRPYELSVRSPRHVADDPLYGEHTATIVFAPGEHVTYHVEMRGLVPC